MESESERERESGRRLNGFLSRKRINSDKRVDTKEGLEDSHDRATRSAGEKLLIDNRALFRKVEGKHFSRAGRGAVLNSLLICGRWR